MDRSGLPGRISQCGLQLKQLTVALGGVRVFRVMVDTQDVFVDSDEIVSIQSPDSKICLTAFALNLDFFFSFFIYPTDFTNENICSVTTIQ